jgi:hypothetical protein
MYKPFLIDNYLFNIEACPVEHGDFWHVMTLNLYSAEEWQRINQNGDWTISPQIITKLKQFKTVIVYGCSENFGTNGLYTLYEILDQNSINFVMLTHNVTEHLSRPRMIYIPYWYHWSIKNFTKADNSKLIRKHKLSCLNKVSRPHRVINFMALRQKPYFKDTFFSIFNAPGIRQDDLLIPKDTKIQWLEFSQALDKGPYTLNPGAEVNHQAYTDSYVNLVTETTLTSAFFISEKTYKPIACGQLFLVLGCKGIISYLRSSGVDVFDDIINHDYYDHEPDAMVRIQKIHEVLDLLMAQNLESIFFQTQERRQANMNNFISGKFDGDYKDLLKQFF